MSVVTNVLLTCSLAETDKYDWVPATGPLQDWLAESGQRLTRIDGLVEGPKEIEAVVFAAGLNHLDREEFCRRVGECKWVQPDNVLLLIQEQDENRFRPIDMA